MGQDLDPAQFLAMVAGAAEVDELGDEEIHGEPVTGLAANVTFEEMIQAQGLDPAQVIASFHNDEDMVQRMLDVFRLPVAVWVGADGHVRQIDLDVGAAMRKMAEEAGGEAEQALGRIELSTSISFFDYSDETIEVDVPDDGTTVDLTEAFQAIADGGS